jgi:hypothetical protein
VFATYYQSLAVKLAPVSEQDAMAWNDLLLCAEMVLFSLSLMYAFPTSEFQVCVCCYCCLLLPTC